MSSSKEEDDLRFPMVCSLAALLLALDGSAAAAADMPAPPAPPEADVYFIEPADGAVLTSPVTVKFGLRGMGVAPAGVERAGTGHHHLLIDVDDGEIDLGLPLPATEQVRHFGAGQTEAEIELAPGEHRLTLVLGDHLHVPHDPPVTSRTITITVE